MELNHRPEPVGIEYSTLEGVPFCNRSFSELLSPCKCFRISSSVVWINRQTVHTDSHIHRAMVFHHAPGFQSTTGIHVARHARSVRTVLDLSFVVYAMAFLEATGKCRSPATQEKQSICEHIR